MSYGLRLVNTAASQVLGNLAVEKDSSGNQIAECSVFADGYTWGTVRTVDVTIGAETASSIPVAIIGDMSSSAPDSCTSQSVGGAENTVSAIGANEILGIGVAPYDCGSNAYYFADSSLSKCSDNAFYCPSTTTTRSVTVSSFSGTTASTTVTMSIANADTLYASGNYAFNDLAGTGVPGVVDIGLPFFYSNTFYFGYDRTPMGGTQTPYVAF